jgi:hypothetical protein
MASAKDILKTAAAQIGTVETPVNVVKYNTWYYGKKVSGNAYPWCAAFVSWVFSQNKAIALIKKSVSTIVMRQWFIDKKQTTKDPKPGDIVFFNWSGGSMPQHVGIVEKAVSKTVIQTIEGNTSDTNYSNGGMVLRRQRNVKYVVGYGRPKYDAEAKTEFERYKVKLAADAPMHEKASSGSKKIKTLKKGKTKTVLGKSGSWLKVKDGSAGWIAEKHTKKV